MATNYILRFDDICPTMNWATWHRIEGILAEFDIRPLVAVVPQNRDAKLMCGPPCDDFWSRVRAWQMSGWSVGLHGFEHLYHEAPPGMVKVNRYSEFAGVPKNIQLRKLTAALDIFELHRIRADAWVAPAHSFDATTVSVLRQLGLTVISDGHFPFTCRIEGMTWVPQQLWRLRPLPFGTWTVCYHHNHWTEQDINRLRSDVRRYRSKIVTLACAIEMQRDISPLGRTAFSIAMRSLIRFKQCVGRNSR